MGGAVVPVVVVSTGVVTVEGAGVADGGGVVGVDGVEPQVLARGPHVGGGQVAGTPIQVVAAGSPHVGVERRAVGMVGVAAEAEQVVDNFHGRAREAGSTSVQSWLMPREKLTGLPLASGWGELSAVSSLSLPHDSTTRVQTRGSSVMIVFFIVLMYFKWLLIQVSHSLNFFVVKKLRSYRFAQKLSRYLVCLYFCILPLGFAVGLTS